MANIFRKLFSKKEDSIPAILKAGATVLDVRSKREFESGNVENSLNIPLQEIGQHLELLKSKQPIVACCASGMRSAMAVKELREKGLDQVYNGGSWQKVNIQLNRS